MPRPLADFMQHILGTQETWQIKLLQQWETIIGNLKTRVHLLKIQNDTLILGVPDLCWMQELYLLTPLLLQTINQHLDMPRIKNLRFKAAGTPEDKKRITKKLPPPPPRKIIPLSRDEEKALAVLTDPDLALAIQDYLQRCKNT